MSQSQPFLGAQAPRAQATTVPQHQLAEFPRYADAERLVDTLSDAGFTVANLRIVGSGLHTVEYVTGRLTTGRAALAGIATGAWFGLLFGLLIGLFTTGSGWFAIIVGSVLIGAVWGAVFGFLAHYATRGSRDFSSVKGLEADSYRVYVDEPQAAEARRLAGLS